MRKDKVISEVLGGESALAPSDLYAREFKRASFGGYDPQEVHRFLERLADQFEAQVNQMRALKDEKRALEEQLDEGRNLQAALRQALTDAHNLGDSILESARREADALLESARKTREQAEIAAQARTATVVQEVKALQAQRNQLRNELLAVVEVHRTMLDQIVPAHVDESAGEAVETAPEHENEAENSPADEEDPDEGPDDATAASEPFTILTQEIGHGPDEPGSSRRTKKGRFRRMGARMNQNRRTFARRRKVGRGNLRRG